MLAFDGVVVVSVVVAVVVGVVGGDDVVVVEAGIVGVAVFVAFAVAIRCVIFVVVNNGCPCCDVPRSARVSASHQTCCLSLFITSKCYHVFVFEKSSN